MTNDGSLVNRMMRASNHHEKEYLVTVNKPVTDAFLERMRKGVRIRKVEKGEVLLDTVTRPVRWRSWERQASVSSSPRD